MEKKNNPNHPNNPNNPNNHNLKYRRFSACVYNNAKGASGPYLIVIVTVTVTIV